MRPLSAHPILRAGRSAAYRSGLGLVLVLLLPMSLSAQAVYRPRSGDMHVYLTERPASPGHLVTYARDVRSGNDVDTVYLERAGVSGDLLGHSAVAVLNDRGIFAEVDGSSWDDPQFVELYPLREPVTDTLSLWGEEYADGRNPALVTGRFDTTLFGRDVRAFTIETPLYRATVADGFGLIGLTDGRGAYRLVSAVIDGVPYNRNDVAREYLPLCVGNGARYEGVRKSVPPEQGDGRYAIVHRILQDTLIGGERYLLRERTPGGTDILRSTADGIVAIPGAEDILPDARADIGTRTGMLVITDSSSTWVGGRQRRVLRATPPYPARNALVDGDYWLEIEWTEGMGMTARREFSHLPIVQPELWQWDTLRLVFCEHCGESGGNRVRSIPRAGDLRVYRAERADTSGVLVSRVLPAPPHIASSPDTVLVQHAGLPGVLFFSSGSLQMVGATGLITEFDPVHDSRDELYPSQEPFEDMFVTNYRLNPFLSVFVITRRFDTTICDRTVRAYSFEERSGFWPVAVTLADGIGLVRAKLFDTELWLTSAIIAGVPCNREELPRDFLPLCVGNMHRYRGKRTTIPPAADDGPIESVLRIERDTLIGGDTWYVRSDQDGSVMDYLRNVDGDLFQRFSPVAPPRQLVAALSTLGDPILTDDGRTLLIVDTAATVIAGDSRRILTAVSPFFVRGVDLTASPPPRIRASYVEGIGMDAYAMEAWNMDWRDSLTIVSTLAAYDVCGSASDAPPPSSVPGGFRIRAAYPVPFSTMITVELELPRSAPVELSVCDALGRLVRTVRFTDRPHGVLYWNWDGRDGSGKQLPPGIYHLLLTGARTSDHLTILRLP